MKAVITATRAARRVMEYIYRREKSDHLSGSLTIAKTVVTDPDRPAVGATPSDDTQLIVKSGHKLPT